jgi:hypothetical protein
VCATGGGGRLPVRGRGEYQGGGGRSGDPGGRRRGERERKVGAERVGKMGWGG